MARLTPAARVRLVEALTSLQRLRRELGNSSEMDEDYKKKKRALGNVIKELQLVSDDETQRANSAHTVAAASSTSLKARCRAQLRRVLGQHCGKVLRGIRGIVIEI